MELLKNRLKTDFGQRLKKAIKNANAKQYQVAEFIGVEPANVSRWVTGKHFPEVEHFHKLCEYLGVNEDYFLEPITAKDIMNVDSDFRSRTLMARIRELEAKLTPENEALIDIISTLSESNKKAILNIIEEKAKASNR